MIKIVLFFFLISFNSIANTLPKEVSDEIPENIQNVIKLIGKKIKMQELVKLVGSPSEAKEDKIYFEIKKYKYALILTLENKKLVEVYYKFITPRVKLKSLVNFEKSYKKKEDSSHSGGYEFYYENNGIGLLFRGSSEPTLSSIKISGKIK